MALARLALRNLQRRVVSAPPPSSPWSENCTLSKVEKQGGASCQLLQRFCTPAGDEAKSGSNEIAVESGKKSKLFPRRNRRRRFWRNDDRDFVPALYEFFPSGLGNALMQATENMNKLFKNLSPSQLMGGVKEKDDHYKLRFELPGVAKEEVKITVQDGVLNIRGEHKEEEEEEGGSSSDEEYWSARSYGYYNTSLLLPDDAKTDEIKAEMKDGVLYVVVPKTEKPKKDVVEVTVR